MRMRSDEADTAIDLRSLTRYRGAGRLPPDAVLVSAGAALAGALATIAILDRRDIA